jgi:glycosyltransferase involved in cell wall biosynthesis
VRFLFVGHLIPTKGIEVLVRAFASLEHGHLVLRGPFAPFDGQPGWPNRIERLIEDTPNATWEGPFGDSERQAVYDGADVLVVPSIWEENSPLVVREAVATGLRVVASNLGGIAEVDPQVRSFAADDVASLTQALAAEIDQGRGRRPPRAFPLERHVLELAGHYEAAVELTRSQRLGPP